MGVAVGIKRSWRKSGRYFRFCGLFIYGELFVIRGSSNSVSTQQYCVLPSDIRMENKNKIRALSQCLLTISEERDSFVRSHHLGEDDARAPAVTSQKSAGQGEERLVRISLL